MYAEQENDILLFQMTANGMELLHTQFAAMLDKEIQAYLSKCHSIPAFLSNITMDLFSKRTFNG